MSNTIISEKLKKLRGKRSQKEVAESLGISQQLYSYYESGSGITDKILSLLSDFYDVSADYLLGRGNPKKPAA